MGRKRVESIPDAVRMCKSPVAGGNLVHMRMWRGGTDCYLVGRTQSDPSRANRYLGSKAPLNSHWNSSVFHWKLRLARVSDLPNGYRLFNSSLGSLNLNSKHIFLT